MIARPELENGRMPKSELGIESPTCLLIKNANNYAAVKLPLNTTLAI